MPWDQSYPAPFLESFGHTRRCIGPQISQVTLQTTEGTAYWTFLGVLPETSVWNYVRGHVTTAGAGTQVAEVAIATTPSVPCRSNQTVTCLWASGNVSDLKSSTVTFANNVAAAVTVPAGVPIWAGIRTAHTGGAEPTLRGMALDLGQGELLQTAASGVLTAGQTYAGVITASVATGQGIWLKLTVD